MIEEILTIMGTAFLAVFGWAYSINNRLIIVETEYEGLKELIETKFDGVEQRLDRIEAAMNGTLSGSLRRER